MTTSSNNQGGMNKYHFNIRLNNLRYNHAGSKAVEDCKAILLADGFEDIEVSFDKKAYLMPFNLIKLFFLLTKYSIKIPPNSLVVVQYPLLGINNYFKYFAKLIKFKKSKLVCIIHDLDSIRSEDNHAAIRQEISRLQVYDAVIAHNESMKSWLKANGYKGKIATIQLFDYLSSAVLPVNLDNGNYTQVAFAGNLARTSFVADLHQIDKIKFNLYGPGLGDNFNAAGNTNVSWKGVFSPEQIVQELQGSFGLIWDGTSINECTGVMGIYLRYNTPHKTSLYLSSGLPVIVPDTSAVADYIVQNKLGISVKNLHDLTEKLPVINLHQYKEMRTNALTVSTSLKNGSYLKNALKQIIELVH